MYEENRRFSWTSLFIKVIIVVIFILFTVWLLSLSNKGLSNKLDVITDNIFAENIDRMKEVGKDYFTTERLPQKVGDIKTLTLAKMYDENLILEVKDKNGNACSAKNSYVSIEKMENEYQMKVYLECGEESDFIIVIMGCYNYCDSDICERKNENDKAIEYEYKKTTGGSWTDYGSWSEWSKVSVTKTDYRQVETKVVKEDYSYDKTITENEYAQFNFTCPAGYTKTNDGTKCYKNVTTVDYKEFNKTCPSGYTKTSDGTKCYKNVTTVDYKEFNFTCPSGYTKTSDGTKCYKNVTTTEEVEPTVCPTKYNGYTLVNQNGFICNYSKEVSTPYQVKVDYVGTCYRTETISVIPCTGCAPRYQVVQVPYSCTKTKTETRYSIETVEKTFTDLVSCPAGYEKTADGKCNKNVTTKEYKDFNKTCPAGYTKTSDSTKCYKNVTTKEYKDFNKTCPAGYTKTSDNTKCYKNITTKEYKDFNKTCPVDYTKTSDGTKCYKEVSSVVEVTGTKDVTYYRYRIREFIGGTVDYKWSSSKNDQKLLDAGYKLTGRTR